MKRVRLLPAAERDLFAIHETIASDNPPAAERWLDAVMAASRDFLSRNPEAGVRRDYGRPALAGLRMFLVPDFANYLVFYRITDIEVQIVRILHGARDIPNVLDPAE